MMFEEQDCINCGVRFGVPVGFTQHRMNDKRSFYCPNGHSMSYRQSDADVLRQERDRLKQQMAYKEEQIAAERRMREAAERSASAYKGQTTRLKKRASAGICPCCNRSFENLRRHMATKHPDVLKEDPALKVIQGGVAG